MSRERCVYIVDDDAAVRDSLSVLLESKGYAVRSFRSAPEFLTIAPSLLLGCLIVDIRMPEMDGLELQQHLIDHSLDFPLIVITGHGDVPLAVRTMKAGAVDFIEKPFALEAILSSLRCRFLAIGCVGRTRRRCCGGRNQTGHALASGAASIGWVARRTAQQDDRLRPRY
jgi:FixJ family two-component response regulator